MGKQDEKIIEELNQRIGEAQEAEGFFITISHRVKDVLHHYQATVNFRPDDCILSINEVEKLVKGSNPGARTKIARITPRTFK